MILFENGSDSLPESFFLVIRGSSGPSFDCNPEGSGKIVSTRDRSNERKRERKRLCVHEYVCMEQKTHFQREKHCVFVCRCGFVALCMGNR